MALIVVGTACAGPTSQPDTTGAVATTASTSTTTVTDVTQSSTTSTLPEARKVDVNLLVTACTGAIDGAAFALQPRSEEEFAVCLDVFSRSPDIEIPATLIDAYCYGFAFGMHLVEAGEEVTNEAFDLCSLHPEEAVAVLLHELDVRLGFYGSSGADAYVEALLATPALIEFMLFYDGLFVFLPEGEFDVHLADAELVAITTSRGHQFCADFDEDPTAAAQSLLDFLLALWFLADEDEAKAVVGAVTIVSAELWCPHVLEDL